MLRIFKPRSPMSMGAWCLIGLLDAAAGARWRRTCSAGAADGARRSVRDRGVLGTYLGSYTGRAAGVDRGAGVGAQPPVPGADLRVHGDGHRRRRQPAGARGAAACRRAIPRAAPSARSRPARWRWSWCSPRSTRSGSAGWARRSSRGARDSLFTAAKWGVRTGLALRLARGRGGPWVHHLASVLYILAGLAFRFAWVGAGRTSASDNAAVARAARTKTGGLSRERD